MLRFPWAPLLDQLVRARDEARRQGQSECARGFHVDHKRELCRLLMRLHAQTGVIENGFVHIPRRRRAEYLHDMTVFPKGKHDESSPDTNRTGAPCFL